MSTTESNGPIPAEQQAGHQPDHDADKPDMDAFAEKLGIVPEGEEPDDAPSVTTDRPASPTFAAIRARQRNFVIVSTVVVVGITLAGLRRLKRR